MSLTTWRTQRLRRQNDKIRGIAGYRAEVEGHRAQHDRWLKRNAEATAIRDAEPVVRCVNPHRMGGTCGAEMRQGDYRCHCCASPNPEYAPRAVEFVLYGDA